MDADSTAPEGPGDLGANPSASSEDSFSLYSAIFLAGVHGSNIGPPGAVPGGGGDAAKARACVKPWHRRLDMAEWTESLDGGSLILNIPFSRPVRVSSLLINQGAGESAVRRIRVYVNRPNGLDFDDVVERSSAPSTGLPASGLPQADFLLRAQDASVTSAEDRIQEYPFGRFALRFTAVNSLHVVLSDAPHTAKVFYLSFRGTAPRDPPNRNDRISVHAEDAASSPMGRVRQSAPGASSNLAAAAAASSKGSAADGTGGQAR